MRHARDDYNRIQDPAGLIPDDEPVFLFRGQDKFAARVLRFYADLVENELGAINACPHCTERTRELIRITRAHADAMEAWPVHKFPNLAPKPRETEPNIVGVISGPDA